MKPEERRNRILEALRTESNAISGTALAKRFDVSRQIIVSDISALKAEGYEIHATHRGYVMPRAKQTERTFKVHHSREETEDELKAIVSLGGRVANVYVWHKVYGRIEAPLDIGTLDDVERFMEGVRSGKSTELMNITGGYHYHTVSADSEETLFEIEKALTEKEYIVTRQ